MNVHGYCPPIDVPDDYPYDVFFRYRMGPWGQAVWKDSWAKFERDPAVLEDVLSAERGRVRLEKAGSDLEDIVRDAIQGNVDPVGAWWALALVRHRGLSVNPTESYLKEIGHDGTGTHSGRTSRFEVTLDPEKSPSELRFPGNCSLTIR